MSLPKKKKCSCCKKILPSKDFAKSKSTKSHLQSYCKKCKAENHEHWKENPEFVDKIQPWHFNRIRSGAKSNGRQFKQTYEEILALPSDVCNICGDKLRFVKSFHQAPENQNASLDRIDSSKGYIKGNLQWLCWSCNHHKNDTPHDDFIQMCRNVYWNNPGPSTVIKLFK